MPRRTLSWTAILSGGGHLAVRQLEGGVLDETLPVHLEREREDLQIARERVRSKHTCKHPQGSQRPATVHNPTPLHIPRVRPSRQKPNYRVARSSRQPKPESRREQPHAVGALRKSIPVTLRAALASRLPTDREVAACPSFFISAAAFSTSCWTSSTESSFSLAWTAPPLSLALFCLFSALSFLS